MPRISLATIAAVASVAALVAVELLRHAPINAESRRWGEGYMPNLPVVTQDGKTLRFYDDVIKDKIVVIDFVYTNCPDICGLTTARLAQVQDKLGDAVGRDIFFVSLSVDPKRDTPEKLKEFADAFHVGPGWLFLTGKPEDMRAINAALGDRSTILSEHRQQIVLGNDALGVWRRDSVLGDLDSFVMDVRGMDQKWRDKAAESKRSAANTDYRLSKEPGQVLYKKLCAPCHTIGVGDRAGPDLRDVTARRDHDWLAKFIMDPYKMREKKDPVALELAAKYPGVLMPRLGLSDNDAADLISYLKTESVRLDVDQDSSSPPPSPTESVSFKLIDQHGKEVTERDFRGKPTLVFFGFTNCPDICPTTLFDLSNRLKELKSDADRLNVLFITVDPQRDTPEELALYLSSFDPRIIGLSGTQANIDAALKAFGAQAHKVQLSGGGYTMDHSASVFMVDGDGHVVGTIDHRDKETAVEEKLQHLLHSTAG